MPAWIMLFALLDSPPKEIALFPENWAISIKEMEDPFVAYTAPVVREVDGTHARKRAENDQGKYLEALYRSHLSLSVCVGEEGTWCLNYSCVEAFTCFQ